MRPENVQPAVRRLLRPLWGFGLVAALTLGYLSLSADPDPVSWLEEFEALKQATARSHANLDWSIERYAIDPPRLARETEEILGQARSRRRARRAVKEFVAAFRDPHFYAADSRPSLMHRIEQWIEPRGSSDEVLTPESSAEAACASVGAHRNSEGWRLKLNRLPGFRAVDDQASTFEAGVVPVGASVSLGLLRIESFGLTNYLDPCVRAWETFSKDLTGSCEGQCRHDFFVQVENEILVDLMQRVRSLEEAGIDMLLVDLVGNGGGTDWADAAARILSDRPLRCPPSAFVRQEHGIEQQVRRVEALQKSVGSTDLDAEDRRVLEKALEQATALLADAKVPCDRISIWETGAVECSSLVHNPSSCGLIDYLPRRSLSTLSTRERIFWPLQFEFEEGLWSGPLYVLVDRATASASEQFLSLLQFNQAATVLGERTTGAGCGFTNGGVSLEMESLGLRVRFPDCVRYQGNGVNELDGIEPDRLIWKTAKDDKTDRLAALWAELQTLPFDP